MFYPHCASSGSPWPATIPRVAGRPVHIEFRTTVLDAAGAPAHAAAHLRKRQMVIEEALMADPEDFARIFVHELFHFVWLRLGNTKRKSYERLLAGELRRRAGGELGWSAEWRKGKLAGGDRMARTRRWREYCCGSFCDTAAWLYSGIKSHNEFTLGRRWRRERRAWFAESVDNRTLSI